MKIVAVVFTLLAWIGACSEENKNIDAAVIEADAVWVNQLAADGCSWHFSVASADSTLLLVPDDGSLEKIESAIGKMEGAYSSTDVHIRYSLTSNKKLVQCGWGHNASYDEIKIREISRR